MMYKYLNDYEANAELVSALHGFNNLPFKRYCWIKLVKILLLYSMGSWEYKCLFKLEVLSYTIS